MRYTGNKLYVADLEETIKQTLDFEYFRNKKVLVLGATGLIGSFLVDCLLHANATRNMEIHVTAVSRSIARLQECFGSETAELLFLEKNVSTLEEDIQVDVVIHAASSAYPRAFRELPVETMLANMLGTYHVMEIARRNPQCRVLYVSSGEVQEEVDHLSVRACYPISKKAGETLCLSYIQEYGTDAVMARPCHTFGPNATVNDNRATAQFISCATKRTDIVLNSAGTQVRSFMYVADCVSGLLSTISCGTAGEVYNVSSDETCSIRQFAEKCAGLVQRKVLHKEASEEERAEASPIREQILDNGSLKSLGWRPIYSIENGIAHSIRIQQNGGNE